ncbi:MAG TPA: hypothetical protein VG365_03675 [Solirubrobacteraceae bacterium]|nr:hypothetical protein [Solirubrobacteraceae bacterium]
MSGALVVNVLLGLMVWGLLGLVVAAVLFSTSGDPDEDDHDGGDDWRRGPPRPDPPRPVRPTGGRAHTAAHRCRQPVGSPAHRTIPSASSPRARPRRRGDLTHSPRTLHTRRTPASTRPPASTSDAGRPADAGLHCPGGRH